MHLFPNLYARPDPRIMANTQATLKIYGSPKKPAFWRNPLLWIALVGLAAILSLLASGERHSPVSSAQRPATPPATMPIVEPVPKPELKVPAASSEAATDNAPQAAADASESQKPAVAPASRKEGDEARTLIAEVRKKGGAQDLSSVFKRAGELSQAGKTTDAYLLYFFAAREGHAQSAYVLGNLADPNHFATAGNLFDKPDPMQALKWYRIAASDGFKEAQSRLLELKKWVEARAHTGDPQAQQLLLSFR
jgi:hypothetical protein